VRLEALPRENPGRSVLRCNELQGGEPPCNSGKSNIVSFLFFF
jgi:hypothetical protein